MTDNGYSIGTDLGGFTRFYTTDYTCERMTAKFKIFNAYYGDGGFKTEISLQSRNTTNSDGDGIASVPNPWTPLSDLIHLLAISEGNIYDPAL